MALAISPAHFDRSLSPEAARALFKASVSLVEIETFTFCNRVCWFCPNATIDRRSENKYMDEGLYLRILADLKSIDYSGTITYSRYNEPLADRIILKRLRQARAELPKVTLLTHTNGDYLTLDYLNELRDAGLNVLRVQVYLGNNDHYEETKITARMAKRLAALGLPHTSILSLPNVRHMARVQFEGMDVTFDARNFDEIGSDRAQLVQIQRKTTRVAPCFVVFQNVYIDFNGAVVPCCNVRSDEPSHKDYVVDSLAEGRSIFQAYANSPLADWRRGLLTFGPKMAPCDTCAYEAIADDPNVRARLDQIAWEVLKVPLPPGVQPLTPQQLAPAPQGGVRLGIADAFKLAVQHHLAGELPQAENIYRQILAQQPMHFEALHHLGLIAHQVGRNDAAEELIRKAIAIKPDYPEAQNNLGVVLIAMGRQDEGVAAHRLAIALNPRFVGAFNNLGVALMKTGQVDDAIAAYQQAISLEPGNTQAKANLAGALEERERLAKT